MRLVSKPCPAVSLAPIQPRSYPSTSPLSYPPFPPFLPGPRPLQVDRAFATFQEYTALFGLVADTAAHNALLYATARSKQPAEAAMLSILQVRPILAPI